MSKESLRRAWEGGKEHVVKWAMKIAPHFSGTKQTIIEVDRDPTADFESWYAENAKGLAGWISVEERLPEPRKRVLTYGRMWGFKEGDEPELFPWRVAIGCHLPQEGKKTSWGCFVEYFDDVFEQASEVTHWMQLPAAPEPPK